MKPVIRLREMNVMYGRLAFYRTSPGKIAAPWLIFVFTYLGLVIVFQSKSKLIIQQAEPGAKVYLPAGNS